MTNAAPTKATTDNTIKRLPYRNMPRPQVHAMHTLQQAVRGLVMDYGHRPDARGAPSIYVHHDATVALVIANTWTMEVSNHEGHYAVKTFTHRESVLYDINSQTLRDRQELLTTALNYMRDIYTNNPHLAAHLGP